MTVHTLYNIYAPTVIKGYYPDGRMIEYDNGLLTCLLWFNPKNKSWRFFATSEGWQDFAPSGLQEGKYKSSQDLDVPSQIIIESFEELWESIGFKLPKAVQLSLF